MRFTLQRTNFNNFYCKTPIKIQQTIFLIILTLLSLKEPRSEHIFILDVRPKLSILLKKIGSKIPQKNCQMDFNKYCIKYQHYVILCQLNSLLKLVFINTPLHLKTICRFRFSHCEIFNCAWRLLRAQNKL